MYQVYISSTYEDLKEFREVAAKAVRRLQCRAVAMEDYLASDERPLDRCLADVRASQAYVGIFAWRYGFKPEGYDKSITHLEYEAAKNAGIPCLIFLLEEGAEWSDRYRDADSSSIEQFRTSLENQSLRSTFENLDTLDARVTASLSLQLQKRGGSERIDIPVLLPYMADRSVQRDQLADALDVHRKDRPRRPFVTVVYGDEREAHSSFVERLEQVTFPKLLELRPDLEPVHHLSMEWARPSGALEDRKQLLQKSLANTLTGRRSASNEEIAQAITRHQCPVMISSSIFGEIWQPNDDDLVKAWFESWQNWPDLPLGRMLLLVLNFILKDDSRGSFFARRKVKKQNEQICEFVDSLKSSKFDRVTVATLDRLEGISERHVVTWIQEEAGQFCREARGPIRDPIELAEKLMPWVRELFSQSENIPMDTLAHQLREQLRQCMNEGGS